jgi:hypothetical protein
VEHGGDDGRRKMEDGRRRGRQESGDRIQEVGGRIKMENGKRKGRQKTGCSRPEKRV